MRIAGEHNEASPPVSSPSPTGSNRRLVWAEHHAPSALAGPSVLRLLHRYGVELAAAIRPDRLDGLERLLGEAAHHGVPVHLWPMLDDRDGRWLSAHNVARFGAFADALGDRLNRREVSAPIVLDLEPPIDIVRGWLRNPLGVLSRRRVARGRIAAIVDGLQARGLQAWATVPPMLVADRPRAGGWQGLLGIDLDADRFERINTMLYTSVALGFARGRLERDDVRSLLFEAARACARRWGAKASASVGAVGRGALGNERVYADPSELADDVALVRAAGIEDIALFELAGVLDRRPAEGWLDALCHTEPAIRVPRRTRRALATIGLVSGLARLPTGAGT
jgi:hypothetical protein